jgi:hypothetical protein
MLDQIINDVGDRNPTSGAQVSNVKLWIVRSIDLPFNRYNEQPFELKVALIQRNPIDYRSNNNAK